jgi:two-component system chemotaxis sensor kinase CheA
MILFDGQRRVILPVAGVHDLVPLAGAVPIDTDGVEGLLNIDGQPVELLDASCLFEGAVSETSSRPVAALLLDQTPWSTAILAPLVVAAGYEVSFEPRANADLVIHLEGDAAISSDVKHIALTREADGSVAIDRYDRQTLRALIETARRARA